MAKKVYVGVNSVAKNVKAIYVGVNGVARKVTKVYVGDANGKARLCYQAAPVGPTVSGTWRIDDQFNYTSLYQEVQFYCTISGQEKLFKAINLMDDPGSEDSRMEYVYRSGSILDVEVCYYDYDPDEDENKWANQAYRTITFEGTQSVSQAFYNWLHANATQI